MENKYSITVAGGESIFTLEVALWLLEHQDHFSISKFTFYDNNAEYQEIIAKAC